MSLAWGKSLSHRKPREGCVHASKHCFEVGFESADCALGGIAVVDVGGHQLVFDIPFVHDHLFEVCTDFIVHDL